MRALLRSESELEVMWQFVLRHISEGGSEVERAKFLRLFEEVAQGLGFLGLGAVFPADLDNLLENLRIEAGGLGLSVDVLDLTSSPA